jgi:hypothetical protein
MINLLNKEKILTGTRFYFNKILLFWCTSAKLSTSFPKLMLKSCSKDKMHKSLNRISIIVLRTCVFINFILLNVLSHVVDETGIVIAAMTRDIIVGNAGLNGNDSSNQRKSAFICTANAFNTSICNKFSTPG